MGLFGFRIFYMVYVLSVLSKGRILEHLEFGI